MKKLTRFLSLIFLVSVLISQSAFGATYAQVEQQAEIGSLAIALVVMGMTYKWLQPEEKAEEPKISFCNNPWLQPGRRSGINASNKPKTVGPRKLISFVAGIVGGFIAYQALKPVLKKA